MQRSGLNFAVIDAVPPLPFPDGTFDLIYAISVFTHITTHWAGWLLELHGLLRPEGVFIATFHGRSDVDGVWLVRNGSKIASG